MPPDLFPGQVEDLVLHDYQQAAIDSAREIIRNGRRRFILCSPTGSGKTIIGIALMKAAAAVGSRSAFITASALITGSCRPRTGGAGQASRCSSCRRRRLGAASATVAMSTTTCVTCGSC